MKTLRQLHEEEQREARIVEAHTQFVATMQQIEREYAAHLERHDRRHKWFLRSLTALLLLTAFGPLLVFYLRKLF